MGIKTNVRPKENKNSRYAITNVSIKDISNIIKKFERFTYKGYVRNRPKHKPTDSYFYLARQLAKYMMRSNAFNSLVELVRTEMTGMKQITILNVCDLDERKPKEIFSDEKLSQVCSMDEGELESVIANESYREERQSESIQKTINTNKEKMQLVKQSTRNLWLQIIQLSMSRESLTYSSVVKKTWTGLMPLTNKRA